MKKAVIKSGGKQYLVTEGQEIDIELVKNAGKTMSFTPLLVIDDKQVKVGSPEVEKATVKATVVTPDAQTDKVTSIRYKAKKRIHTVKGHRQRKTTIKVTSIA